MERNGKVDMTIRVRVYDRDLCWGVYIHIFIPILHSDVAQI
jgi:hypothetical protein